MYISVELLPVTLLEIIHIDLRISQVQDYP